MNSLNSSGLFVTIIISSNKSLMVEIILEIIVFPPITIFALVIPPNRLLEPPARITPEILFPLAEVYY